MKRSGAVLVGDRLLAINEVTLRGKPLWKAFELLRTSGDTVKLLIKRSLAATSAKSSQGKAPCNRFHFIFTMDSWDADLMIPKQPMK